MALHVTHYILQVRQTYFGLHSIQCYFTYYYHFRGQVWERFCRWSHKLIFIEWKNSVTCQQRCTQPLMCNCMLFLSSLPFSAYPMTSIPSKRAKWLHIHRSEHMTALPSEITAWNESSVHNDLPKVSSFLSHAMIINVHSKVPWGLKDPYTSFGRWTTLLFSYYYSVFGNTTGRAALALSHKELCCKLQKILNGNPNFVGYLVNIRAK